MKNNNKNNYKDNQHNRPDRTGYKNLDHKQSDARNNGMSYESLQKMVKKL